MPTLAVWLSAAAFACAKPAPPPAEVTFDCGPNKAHERAEAMRCWVAFLASPALQGRNNGSPGGERARGAIMDAFTHMWLTQGGDAGFVQPIPDGANVIATIPGQHAAHRDEVIVLGAHYDHIGVIDGKVHPGADDNASGVAVLIEVARALAASPPARTVMVIAFDSEEPPEYLTERMGSSWWVAHPTVRLDRVKAMMALDMVGGDMWQGANTPLVLLGMETFEQTPVADIASLAANILPSNVSAAAGQVGLAALHLRAVEDLPSGRQAFSDYGAFRDKQIPSMLLTSGRSPHYHRPSDTPATLRTDKLEAAADVTEALIRRLASPAFTPAWRAIQPLRAADAVTISALITAALGEGGSGAGAPLSSKAKATLRAQRESLSAITARSPDAAIVASDAERVIGASLTVQHLLGGE